MDIELHDRLIEVLDREAKAYTKWVHEQATEYVKRHGAGNPAVPLTKFLEDATYRACPTILEMEGANWKAYDQVDLARFERIIVKEMFKIRNARRQQEEV